MMAADDANRYRGRIGRLIASEVLHLLFFGLIVWKMTSELKKAGVDVGGGNAESVFGVYICTIFGGIAIIMSSIISGNFGYKFEYINISNLLFILGTMVQYGITLHYAHKNARDHINKNSSINLTITASTRTECVTLENYDDEGVFYILLLTFPVLVIVNMIYPYPEDEGNTISTLSHGFAALDILDMAELMFGDVACYQMYGAGGLFFFYLALGVSAILIAFSYGLEQQQKEKHTTKDWYSTLMNMIFNDLLFFSLRVSTMAKQGRAYFGVIFASKELLSLLVRLFMLCTREINKDTRGTYKFDL